MLKTITGIYRNGQIELTELPPDLHDNTQVIVTFIEKQDLHIAEHRDKKHHIDLVKRGIDQNQAADLRKRLQTFAEDWDSVEMDIYNDYDAAKDAL